MKNYSTRLSFPVLLFLAFLLTVGSGFLNAQSIDASEIIAMVNAGKAVELNNTAIEGDLDFTQLKNMRETNTGGKRKSYRSTVESKLTFRKCTFNGQVLGFVNEEDNWGKSSQPIYHANFDEAVVFVDCEFRQDAAFKYSIFREGADFGGSKFRRDANFKYTEFRASANFANTHFIDEANFKYTDFTRAARFSSVVFEDEANFKYTKLNAGVTFANSVFRRDASFKYTELGREVSFSAATFKGEADFKYIKFPSGTDLTNTSFGRNTDFKYATLGGKKFSR